MRHLFVAEIFNGQLAVVERSARGAPVFVFPCPTATEAEAVDAAVDMQREYDREHPQPSRVAA